jgi:hypothetical protein
MSRVAGGNSSGRPTRTGRLSEFIFRADRPKLAKCLILWWAVQGLNL